MCHLNVILVTVVCVVKAMVNEKNIYSSVGSLNTCALNFEESNLYVEWGIRGEGND